MVEISMCWVARARLFSFLEYLCDRLIAVISRAKSRVSRAGKDFVPSAVWSRQSVFLCSRSIRVLRRCPRLFFLKKKPGRAHEMSGDCPQMDLHVVLSIGGKDAQVFQKKPGVDDRTRSRGFIKLCVRENR